MKKLGISLLLVCAVGSSIILIFTKIDVTKILYLVSIVVVCSVIIILSDRIVAVRYKDIEIRTVTEKAISDAKRIEEVFLEVQAQKEALDLIVRDANATRKELLEMKDIVEEAYSRLLRTEQVADKAEKYAQETMSEVEKQARKAREEAVQEVYKTLMDIFRS